MDLKGGTQQLFTVYRGIHLEVLNRNLDKYESGCRQVQRFQVTDTSADPRRRAQAAVLLTGDRWLPISNLDLDSDCPESVLSWFSSSLHIFSGIVPQIR
jgi:hypothetical protein